MADKIVGKVQYINEKEGKYGPMFSIKVDGTNYGVGKFAPRGIDQGDTVEFEVEYNGNYPNVAKGSLRKVEGAKASAPSAQADTRKAFTKATSNDDRQVIISKQAALNTALEFIKFAKDNETLPVPKTKNEGYGYLKTLWLKEAAALFELNTGEVWELPETDVEEAAPKPAKKAAAKKAAPPVEIDDDDEYIGDVEDGDSWD